MTVTNTLQQTVAVFGALLFTAVLVIASTPVLPLA